MPDGLATNLMLTEFSGLLFLFSHFLSFQDEKKLDSWFLSSFHQTLTLMCVWLSFQTKEALFAALRLTSYGNYEPLLHLMAILRSVSDSTRVIALC